MSGTSPQWVSRIAKRVPGAAMRMSAPDMIWKPPPNATPCTAAITGIGNCRQPQETCCGRIDSLGIALGRSTPEPPAAMLAMSSPAQKPRPSPDSTTQRTSCDRGERVDRGADALEHRRIDRIHLVGAGQPDIGDAGR